MHKDNIFREYDVRGIVEKDYDFDFANVLGKAYATFVKLKLGQPAHSRARFKIAIGRDVRPSGVELSKRLITALLDLGFDVLDLGVVPTPLVYFSTFKYDVDGAICVTGSHNPPEYNGFKISLGQSTLHGSEIQELKAMIKSGDLLSSAQQRGDVSHMPIVADYQAHVKTLIPVYKRKIKVVVDAGNATGGVVAPQLLRDLGCEVIELFCDVDGRFPNHHPDPSEEKNLVDIKAAVKKYSADVGIAFDGDSDRIGAIDENGRTLFGDELLILYAREILSRKPGAKIIGEVKCSHKLYQDVAKHGGVAIMWKTGHSLIKSKMKTEGAALAGEMSGHVFFKDRYFGYDDAIYSAARLIEILDKDSRPLSQHLSDLPVTVSTAELRIDCPDDVKFDVVDEVKTLLSQKYRTIDIDGVRIETDTGWGLLRASNTQPVVVMRFEAQTQAQLDDLQKTVETAFTAALRKRS